MLGAHVLREAEKPSGNAEAQADYWDVQPASDSLFAFCGRSMDLCEQSNILVTPHFGDIYHLFCHQKESGRPSAHWRYLCFFRKVRRVASSHWG